TESSSRKGKVIMLHKTTPEEQMMVYEIASKMKKEGDLPETFIVQVAGLASLDQGVFDLMSLWNESESVEERNEIIGDLQDSIDDYGDSVARPVIKPKISFEHLDKI